MKSTMSLLAVTVFLASPAFADCQRVRAEAKVAELTALLSNQAAPAPPARLLTVAREAVSLCDTWAGAHNALGTALEASGDYAGAVAAYERAAELDPQWSLPVLGMGDVAKAQGDAAGAEEHYARARNLSEVESGYGFTDAETIRRELATGMGASRAPRWSDSGPADNTKKVVRERDGVKMNLSVLFEKNSSSLMPDGMRQLDEVGRALQAATSTEVYVIEGHASSEGSPDHNMSLSRVRAEAVRAYLTSRFTLKARLVTVPRGSTAPVMENGTENLVKSRRVSLMRKQ